MKYVVVLYDHDKEPTPVKVVGPFESEVAADEWGQDYGLVDYSQYDILPFEEPS